MMKVTMQDTVLHDRVRYEAGEQRVVQDELGRYFVDHGWAVSEEYQAAEIIKDGPVTLDVDNSVLGMGDSNG